MTRSSPKRSLEVVVAEVAKRQHGVVALHQLPPLGVTVRQLRYRREKGEWIRYLPSVVRFHWSHETWLQRVWATWLWAGPLSALSHQTAAALLGIASQLPDIVEVTLPVRFKPASPAPWIRVYRSTWLERNSQPFEALSVTTAARTLVDLAAGSSRDTFEDVAQQALSRGLVSRASLHAQARRERNRTGTRALRAFLVKDS